MTEATYVIDLSLDGQNRYRHRHVREKDQIVEFRVQYETYVAGQWHPIEYLKELARHKKK